MSDASGAAYPVAPRIDLRFGFAWIAIAGLIMAIGTIGVGWYLDDRYGAAVARTGALTVFSIFNLVFSFTALDEKRTMFSLEGFADRKFLLTTGMSITAIVMGTELNVFNRFFQTTGLTRAQWGACLVIPLGLVAASEAWKWYLRRRDPENPPSLADEPVPAPATV